jgi:translocation and assembly module TamB
MKPHSPLAWVVEAAMVALLAAGVALVALRFGPLTTEARLLIESQVNGFQVGPFGKLRLRGVHGDVLRGFSVRRLTLSDAKGVWIEADDARIRWRPGELLFARLHVQSLIVGKIIVYRQPVLGTQSQGKGQQISVQFDAVHARVQLEPAFSQTRAVYDFSGRFDQERSGRTAGVLDMESALRPGDFLRANLDLGRTNTLKLDVDGRETGGGGIAGSFGLAADQPFLLSAHLTGVQDARRLSAVLRSGQQTPVSIQGGWTPAGGRVDAHLMLQQSRWTQGWARAFGPEAQIALAAKPHGTSLYDVDVGLKTDNLSLTARGPADAAKQTSKGLAVTLIVNSLAKVVPQPVMGKGQVVGTLSGSLSDLRLTGQAQVMDFDFLGYRLARVAGPGNLVWRNRQLDIQASAAGFGASGDSLVAAAGGPAPTGKIELSRLPDGRVLIRSMSILGKGVKIEGQGGQNLIGGGLTFKGRILTPDMAVIRPGATGLFEASWSAAQSTAPGAPWTFAVEGRGERFATGAAQLDQLLGAQPQFSGSAGFVGDVVSFDRLTLKGAKADANAQGQWSLDGAIKFGLGWQADGPLALGPVDLDGQAKGLGQLTGSIGAPRLDLQSDLDSLNVPNMKVRAVKLGLSVAQGPGGVDGRINLAGESDYGPARLSSNFRIAPHGVELTGLDVDGGGVRAKGQLSLFDQGQSTADLTLAVGPGAVLTDGEAHGRLKLAGGQGPALADLELDAKGAVLRGQAVALGAAKLAARGPIDRLPYQVQADGAVAHAPFKLNGSGIFSAEARGSQATFDGSGQLRRSDFHTVEPVQIRLDEGDHYARLRLALGGGRAEFDGREGGGATSIKAVLTGVDLAFVSEDFTGRFDADLELSGKGKSLQGSLQAALKNAHSRDARAGLSIDGQVKAKLLDDQLTIESELNGGQGLRSSASFVLPADASAEPFRLAVARDRPMHGVFQADGEIQPLWDLFLGGERTLGGMLTAKADFSGTLGDPKITGRADLTDGRFEDYPTGLKLHDATVGVSLNTNTIAVDKFAAADNQKGSITGSGQVSLARGGASSLLIKLNNFRLVDNDTATANATGDVTIVRDADGHARIAGALEVVNGEINAAAKTNPDIPTVDVVEKNRPFNLDEQLQPPPSNQPGVELDIALTAKRGLLVKGRGLNLDMSLDAKVTGTSAKPVLSGQAHVVRGDYDFGGQRFTFDNRGTVELSNDPRLIRLDLTATRDDPNLTAVISIQGTAAKPQINLSSTPVLPKDEVLSQVLFGASASQLSPLQAAELASALTALASGGGFDVIGGIRSFARLDRLALVGGSTTGVSVAGGKYITDRFYVEVAGGARDGPSADVEYRITRNLSLASRLANVQPANTTNTTPGTVTQTGSTLSIRWHRDFRDPAPKPAPGSKATPAPKVAPAF